MLLRSLARAALSCALLLPAGLARADEDAPRAGLDLRVALSPVAFQAAITQSWFGSALRVEYAPVRLVELSADGRVAWLNANHGNGLHGYTLRAGLSIHLAQSVQQRPLYGTVYAADTAAVGGAGIGSDQDLQVPASERLRTGMSAPRDIDPTLQAEMRSTHSLRLGAAYTQLLERARSDVDAVTRNRLPVAHLGYAYTTYWNIPERVTGRRELGFRRYYGDLLLTLPSLGSAAPERTPDGARIAARPVGGRLGMQGTLGGLFAGAPAVGFAYDLELGVYPGRSGLEGYLFLALGIALEAGAR